VEEIALTRSKSKHPPSKTVAEQRKIKAEVDNSESKKNRRNMANPRNLRLAELDREIEAKNREEQNMTNANEIKADEVRLSRAESINDRADEFMRTNGTDYPTAVREVVRLSDNGHSEPSVAEVERHMKAHDISDFGTALREVISGQQTRAVGSNGTRGTSAADENSELAEILKARGYDA